MFSKLSQEKVAELSGISRTYITKLENGKQDVEVRTLKKIVEAGLDKHLTILIE
jgi:transcriptional regulator with XRE-family HTH domain